MTIGSLQLNVASLQSLPNSADGLNVADLRVAVWR